MGQDRTDSGGTDSIPSIINPSPNCHTYDRLLGVKWMAYFGVVDINFSDMTLSVFPYDARARENGSTELADLLDDVRPALLDRGVPMRPVGSGRCLGGLGMKRTLNGHARALLALSFLHQLEMDGWTNQDPASGIYFVDIHLAGPSSPPVSAIVDLGAGKRPGDG